ncbi:MAG TPA: hypothetical protein VML57_00330 [Burkholderiales bacterium]|nr:hypothetical protein [Burkholderiales bacterium]
MADDADRLLVIGLDRVRDLLQHLLAALLERRPAGIEEQLLRHVDGQHVLVAPHLELALLQLLVEVGDQRVVLRLRLPARAQQHRALALERLVLRAQPGLLALERGLGLLERAFLLLQGSLLLLKRAPLAFERRELRLQVLELLLERRALPLQGAGLLCLLLLQLVVGSLRNAAAQHEGRR